MRERPKQFIQVDADSRRGLTQTLACTEAMTVPIHIDIFNKVTAKVLLQLYDNFPRPVDLDPALIGMDIVLSERLESDSEELKALVGTPEATIDFLVSEGFVRFDPAGRYIGKLSFPEAVLTAKGLALLQRVPESVDSTIDRRTYVQRIKSATADGVKAAVPEVIGALVGGLLGAG